MKIFAAGWKLAVSAAAAVVVYILVANAITQPLAGDQRRYTAEFVDASGLHMDADVRIRGVRVGKVQRVRLERHRGQSLAAVDFTLDKQYGVGPGTRFAIKFQALTGLRYLDVQDPMQGPAVAEDSVTSRIPTSMTQSSLDVTELFNGLQPVIATLSPEEINIFTANVLNYLQGDGSGLAPMVDSIRKLTRFVSERQQVISTLMNNLSEVSAALDQHSLDFIQIIEWANRPFDGAFRAIDEFRKSELTGPGFLDPILELLNNIGLPTTIGAANHYREGPWAGPDIPNNVSAGVDRAFHNVENYADAFKFLPAFFMNVPEPAEDAAPMGCSNGRFELPNPMAVFVNGQRLTLCKQ